jgi:hypothetical protein
VDSQGTNLKFGQDEFLLGGCGQFMSGVDVQIALPCMIKKKERRKEIAFENIRNHLFLPFSEQRNRSRYIVYTRNN